MVPTSRIFGGMSIALLVLARAATSQAGPEEPPAPAPTAADAEPAVKRFALIGPLELHHWDRDERAALRRLITAAGWTVEYDLPPRGAGNETGQLTGKIDWYVVRDQRRYERAPEDSREAPDNENDNDFTRAARESVKREIEAIKQARKLGIRPMKIGELMILLADTGQVLPEDRPPAQSTSLRLETPISMCFPNETPLEDILKYIKSATQGSNDTGIPIYVDPLGLNEAGKTMTSPVVLDLVGVPLRISLRLLLKQLDLGYTIEEGVLFITSETRLEDRVPAQLLEKALRGELGPDELRQALEQIKTLNELRKAVDEFRKMSREKAR
jgi:hypothetical protein